MLYNLTPFGRRDKCLINSFLKNKKTICKALKRLGVVFSLCLALLSLTVTQGLSAATKVPDFSFPSVPDKERIDIRDFRGKVVLINFWATWCPPCLKEMPSLVSLQDEYGPQGFSVIGISIDQSGPKVVANMMKKIGVNYPVIIGDGKLSRDFGGVTGVPVSFLIDRSGNVLKRYTGFVSHKDFDEDIKVVIR